MNGFLFTVATVIWIVGGVRINMLISKMKREVKWTEDML